MKKIKYIAPVMYLLICLFACTDNVSYIYPQKISTDKGYYYLLHVDKTCPNPVSGVFAKKYPVIDHIKLVYHKYCPFCVDEYDTRLWGEISIYNQYRLTSSYMDYSTFDEHTSSYIELFDTTKDGSLKMIYDNAKN